MSNVILAALLVGTFSIAGFLQTMWLRSRFFRHLALPLDLGLTLFEKRILGDNKTVAGLLGMIIFSAFSFSVCGPYFFTKQISPLEPLYDAMIFGHWNIHSLNIEHWTVIGAVGGLIYMMGELPNSFLKRRFDISPGELPNSKIGRACCILIDQTDSVLAASLFFYFLFALQGVFLLYSCVFGALAHWGFNFLLFRLKMKSAPL